MAICGSQPPCYNGAALYLKFSVLSWAKALFYSNCHYKEFCYYRNVSVKWADGNSPTGNQSQAEILTCITCGRRKDRTQSNEKLIYQMPAHLSLYGLISVAAGLPNLLHMDYLSMQYIFHCSKKGIFRLKFVTFFLLSFQTHNPLWHFDHVYYPNSDTRCLLEPASWGDSVPIFYVKQKYSMLSSKNKKLKHSPANPTPFFFKKLDYEGC